MWNVAIRRKTVEGCQITPSWKLDICNSVLLDVADRFRQIGRPSDMETSCGCSCGATVAVLEGVVRLTGGTVSLHEMPRMPDESAVTRRVRAACNKLEPDVTVTQPQLRRNTVGGRGCSNAPTV